ncbi:MAG: tRNA (N6-threonylcarbamoyladenosine(37)-N6)-methyltransferase TrmO [Anaerolineales bacterium]|nr:tRNA (N6-threonylcarbamoyladenosine(37)-N6)-methyltransferase TrmO [Anaerolineales bacterium]
MPKEKIEEIKKQLADLKKRWPAHSVPPAMMAQLDDLETALSQEMNAHNALSEVLDIESRVFEVRAIGRVENAFDEPAPPEDIRSCESTIILDPHLAEGLQGLEKENRIMVVFYFHRSEGYDLLQHPRGDESRPKRGVFALCSPRRPNPIGVTVVDLLGIQDNILRVRGLDAINGTPVLDLKPAG